MFLKKHRLKSIKGWSTIFAGNVKDVVTNSYKEETSNYYFFRKDGHVGSKSHV